MREAVMLLGRSNRLLCSSVAALFLVSAAGFAVAQSDPPAAGQSAPAIGPPEAKTNGSSATPAAPSAPPPAAGPHNSTTGAASTDVPMPPVVLHIPSASDAAKFNATADADDKKPTLAHALALTDEQKRLIASSVAGKEASPPSDFKPEVAALAPSSAKLQDLPQEITAKIPYLQPYKVAVVDNQILLVDPGNSNVVVGIVNR
jgi:hypothetical protein